MSDILAQLNKLDVSKLKLNNGNTVEKELKRHASILADCIMEELNNVYDSYSPNVYRRTYGLYDSLCVDDGLQVDISSNGKRLSIGIHFDDGAIHKGFYGDDANTAILLNEGWRTHGRFANVPYLGYREGTHFIEKGIERYRAKVDKPYLVKIYNK